MYKSAIAGLAMVVLGVSCAMAQEVAAFTALTACRIDAETVSLSYRYMGGACEAALPAEMEPASDSTLSVTVSTTSTAEMCTMQLIEIDGGEKLAVGLPFRTLELTLLNPAGAPQAAGTAPIIEPPECTVPEPVQF